MTLSNLLQISFDSYSANIKNTKVTHLKKTIISRKTIFSFPAHTINNTLLAYWKIGTRDPSGTLAGPYKNKKTGIQDFCGTLEKSENRDPIGTLVGPKQDPKKTGKPGRGTLLGL